LTESRSSSWTLLRCFLGCLLFLGNAARGGQRAHVADSRHHSGQHGEGQERQARHQAKKEQHAGGNEKRARVFAELIEDRLVGRADRAALGNEKTGGQRNNQRRNLRDETVADRQLGEDIDRLGDRHAVAGVADDDAADDVDRGDDQARDRVAAHEFRCAVHRAVEGAFLFEFLAPGAPGARR
jgi:hypothetical protein